MEWLSAAISAVAVVLVAVIEAAAARERKAHKEDRERTESRSAVRAEESRLSMEMMSANCALSLILAKKLSGMHTNGDVEEAMEKARAAQGEYSEFLQKIASRQLSKT